MDIHPPEHPIRSLRDFAVQIFTVTCGILIALGLETHVEHRKDAALARQTRDAFATDMTATLARVTNEHQNIGKVSDVLRANVAALEARQKHAEAKSFAALNVSFLYLRNSAWDSALATQAVRLLTPRETQTISRVYNAQLVHNGIIGTGRDEVVELLSYGDTDALTPDEVRAYLRVLRKAVNTAGELADLDAQMIGQYQDALAAIKAGAE